MPVDGVAIDIGTRDIVHIDTGEVLRARHVHLADMVVGNRGGTVIGVDTTIAGTNRVARDVQHILAGVGTIVVNTVVTTRDGTVLTGNRIRNGGGGHGTTDGKTGVGRGVGVVSRDMTAVEGDVRGTVASDDHTSGHRIVLALQGQVAEYEVVDIHQGNRAKEVGTRISMVIGDDDRVHIVALEGDGVGGRLSDKVLREVKVLIGTGTEMKNGGTIHAAIGQCSLHIRHRGEIGVGTTNGIVAMQQTIAGITSETDGIVQMVTIHLTITRIDVDGNIVVAMTRRESTQREGGRLVKAEGTGPGMGAGMSHHVVFILNLQGHIQGRLVWATRTLRMGGVTLVLEVERYRLCITRNETMGEWGKGGRAVQGTVVVLYVVLVMPSNHRRIQLRLTAVHIVHMNAIINCIIITDGREIPLGSHIMTRSGQVVGVDDIRASGPRAIVDFIFAIEGVQIERVIVMQCGMDGVRSDVVQHVVVLIHIDWSRQLDGRTLQLAVGKDDLEVVNIPTCTHIGSR